MYLIFYIKPIGEKRVKQLEDVPEKQGGIPFMNASHSDLHIVIHLLQLNERRLDGAMLTYMCHHQSIRPIDFGLRKIEEPW